VVCPYNGFLSINISYMKRELLTIIAVSLLVGCKKNVFPPEQKIKDTVSSTSNTIASLSLTSSAFKGVSWADARDNFEDGKLVLSGTDSTNSYSTIQSEANNILTGFQNAGANTVRLPINPATVLQSWWLSYRGAIDQASAKGMKVLLGYWEGTSSKDGLIDDTTAFYQMWDKVVTAYQGDSNIYFEVFNEPHGYSVTDLTNLYARWLSRYPTLSANRVVLDGAGYSWDVNDVGADSRLSSCLLSFHDYTWFESSKKTTADWEQPVKSLAYPTRTIVTEFGTSMTDGTNYMSAPGSNVNNTYLQGMTNSLHDVGAGGIYWPGLRTGDSYSMFTLSGTSLTVNNTSGLTRLKYAWGTGTITPPFGSFTAGAYYKIINKNSGKSLDVYNSSTANGGTIDQWDYWAGTNQQWSFAALDSGYFYINNRNSNKVLDVTGQSTTAGASIVQWSNKGIASQKWQIIDIGFGYYKILNKNSGFALDVNGQSTANGASIIQWNWNSGGNQQWQIAAP
jgi:hypothetical protein